MTFIVQSRLEPRVNYTEFMTVDVFFNTFTHAPTMPFKLGKKFSKTERKPELNRQVVQKNVNFFVLVYLTKFLLKKQLIVSYLKALLEYRICLRF